MRVLASVAAATFLCGVAANAAGQAPTVWTHTFQFVDTSRTIRLPHGGRIARPITTVIRAPATGGAHPLIVFGHGFAGTPAAYARLLDAWAESGFVVAAPVFPLGNANAPGGPDEDDLVNQPRDMRFVITRLLALDAESSNVLAGKIDPTRIAVAGHSDGAETALAAAYDHRYRDSRIRAAIIMAGAAFPHMGAFPRNGPPLLAIQGTADDINRPANTAAYFERARRPKFLLWLIGAAHRPPYTTQQPQLGIVEQATIAFLNHYFSGAPLATFNSAADVAGVTRVRERP